MVDNRGIVRLGCLLTAICILLLIPTFVFSGSSSEKKQEIYMVGMEYLPDTAEFLTSICNDFKVAHPNVNFEVEVVPWEQGHDRLITLLAGNRPPDLCYGDTFWVMQFEKMGALQALDAYAGRDKKFIDGFFFLEPATWKGKLYGLPYAASTRAFYYRTDLLKKAGYDKPPDNWDDLLKASLAVAKPPNMYGFGMQGKDIETDLYFQLFLWSAGGSLYDRSGKCIVNNPEGVEALTFMNTMVTRGATQPNPTGTAAFPDLWDLFKNERVAMEFAVSILFQELDRDKPHIVYDIGQIPSKKGHPKITNVMTDTMMMFSSSKNKDLVWELIKHHFKSEYQLDFAKKLGLLPVRKDVAADTYFTGNPRWKPFVDSAPYGIPLPLTPTYSEVQKELIKMVQYVFLGEKKPKQALDDTAKTIDQINGF
jgi:multiple sugar transport system substrate-binding protein